MKLKFTFFILLLFIVGIDTYSQSRIIEIIPQQKDDYSVDFNYMKNEPGSFYLKVYFTRLENALKSDYGGVVRNSGGRLFVIKPMQPNVPVIYSYRSSWIRGVLDPKIDTSFVYLLPLAKNKKSMVTKLQHLGKHYFGNTEPKNWIAFKFNADPGDTIFASRKGLVVEVKDEFAPDSTTSISYSTKENNILIEHEDGTLAKYMVLKNGSVMVKPGQVVLPHTPLAIAGTYDVEDNSQVRLYIYYLSDDELFSSEKSTLATRKHYYSFVNPVFHTSEGDLHLDSHNEYVMDLTEEHILKELSKKELKKMKK